MQIFQCNHGELTRGDNTGHSEAIQVRRQGDKGLSEIEINALKKSKLFSYEELSWCHMAPLMPSQQISVELSILATNDLKSIEQKIDVFHRVEFKQDTDNSSKCNCAICLEEIQIGDWYKKLPSCKHCFHAPCIDQWLSNRETCPVCRKEVIIRQSVLGLSVVDISYTLEEKVLSEIING